MISIVIPTRNAEATLGETLTALIPAVVEGLVRDVVIVDGQSTDGTLRIADAFGATLLRSHPGRGQQLAAGAAAARGRWLLFLHADTRIEPGWERDVAHFIERVEAGKHPRTAAAFRFALDDTGVMPRLVEVGVGVRCALLKLPYGDQGLLIERSLYLEIGGYRSMPLMAYRDAQAQGRHQCATLPTRRLRASSGAEFDVSRVVLGASSARHHRTDVRPLTCASTPLDQWEQGKNNLSSEAD
jgi:glycosyltransferase involved in cell wall biosynthesis